MAEPIVGQPFTTQRAGIVGTVQEVIKNSTGTLRVRLELADGTPRWTTVK